MAPVDERSLLEDLERLVVAESKTGDYARLEACASVLAEIGNRILAPHATAEVIETSEGPIVRWMLGSGAPRLALVGHYDTVFPAGVLDTFPFSIEDDVIRGPGTFDMKAGILVALHGCAEALRRDPRSLDGTVIFCNPDEEDGSKASRAHLQALVDAGLSTAFVFEGGNADGDVCSERMGGMWVDVTLSGRSAHGSQPQLGANALTALGRYLTQVERIVGEHRHSTIAPTMASSGDAINTVPALATLTIDTRSPSEDEQGAILAALGGIETEVEGVASDLTVRHRFAPLAPSASSGVLERMRMVCERFELPVPEAGLSMGITDANHLSAMGIRVLDGLGPRGGGEHSPNEWTSLSSMIERIRLVSFLAPDALL